MKNQLLLLKDVENLGRSGDIVTTAPGFARNFLLPQGKAVIAKKHTVRLQEKLKAERVKKAAADKKEADAFAKELVGKTIEVRVKIDGAGHMYGSVTAVDIVRFLEEQLKMVVDRKGVLLPKAIKKLGTHKIALKLTEGVPASITLEVQAEEEAAKE
ncbi:MAG: 50S ribosomal protein L9 [Chlamydiae bacterium]|nr:50S ribosomal protein L9 [Chlamydiota bacterium]